MEAKLDVDTIRQIAAKHDQMPESEDQDRHIRQVHPGNHVAKLRPGTVTQLNSIFAVILDKLDYDTGGSS